MQTQCIDSVFWHISDAAAAAPATMSRCGTERANCNVVLVISCAFLWLKWRQSCVFSQLLWDALLSVQVSLHPFGSLFTSVTWCMLCFTSSFILTRNNRCGSLHICSAWLWIGWDRGSCRLEPLLFPWELASEPGSGVSDHVLVQTPPWDSRCVSPFAF